MLHVVCHVERQSGRRFAPAKPFHALCIVQQHPVLQVHDAFRRRQQLALLNIGVAERERIVCLHAALNRRAGDQRGGDDKQILPLPKRLRRDNAAADSRCGRKPCPQRRGIALAYHAQQKLFQIVGVVRCLRLRCGGQPLLRLPLLLPERQFRLLLLVNADVPQLQLFLIQHIVERAQHLQHAFHRHADNAPHAGEHGVRVLAG